jgi:RHS repeat-associated protein
LQSIATPNGQTTTFLYDFLGNLISQQTVSSGVNVTQKFLLDELTNVVYQTDSAGNQFSILTGRAIDQHLAVVSSGGQVNFGLTDAINGTVAHTRENGAIAGQGSYEPFGQTTFTGADYPFQFTGRTRAPANLYYYRARFYDPTVGRFLSEDPIGFGGGDLNLYRYVANNPVNQIDAFGLDSGEFLGSVILEMLLAGGDFAFEPGDKDPGRIFPRKKDFKEPPKELNSSCSLRKPVNPEQDAIDVIQKLRSLPRKSSFKLVAPTANSTPRG